MLDHPAGRAPSTCRSIPWRGLDRRLARSGGASHRTTAEDGFTLVEMLVVLVIMGLLVGLVGPKVFNQLSDAKAKTAKIQIKSFANGLDLFFLDNGRNPTAAEGLAALYVKPPGSTNWNGPYLRGNGVPKDPWNAAYIYRSPGQGRPYEIISLGSDGREGGTGSAADIVSWEQ
nr:type II secretion system major pseudopilin GspG [Methylobacterium sp. Leaf113]